jgi:hypothetical protein
MTTLARFNGHESPRTSANIHVAWCPLGFTTVPTHRTSVRRPRSRKASPPNRPPRPRTRLGTARLSRFRHLARAITHQL